MARDVQWRFIANRWLATDELDKKTFVELKPTNDEGQDGIIMIITKERERRKEVF